MNNDSPFEDPTTCDHSMHLVIDVNTNEVISMCDYCGTFVPNEASDDVLSDQ